MDLQFLNIEQSNMTDAEIEKILEQEKESNKATFFATTSGVGKRYKNKRLSDYIADTPEKQHILEEVKNILRMSMQEKTVLYGFAVRPGQARLYSVPASVMRQVVFIARPTTSKTTCLKIILQGTVSLENMQTTSR